MYSPSCLHVPKTYNLKEPQEQIIAPNKYFPLFLTLALELALDLALEKHMSYPDYSPNSSYVFGITRDAWVQLNEQFQVVFRSLRNLEAEGQESMISSQCGQSKE